MSLLEFLRYCVRPDYTWIIGLVPVAIILAKQDWHFDPPSVYPPGRVAIHWQANSMDLMIHDVESELIQRCVYPLNEVRVGETTTTSLVLPQYIWHPKISPTNIYPYHSQYRTLSEICTEELERSSVASSLQISSS